jgi:hypothetical protein
LRRLKSLIEPKANILQANFVSPIATVWFG